jgi:hypothetical protein
MARSLSAGAAPKVVRKSAQNVVQGRIEISGTNSAAGTLVVRLFDVVAAAPEGGRPVRHSLGSTITRDGNFAIRYDDDQLKVRRPDGSRPDLQLTVSAPEGRGGTDVGPTLFESELRSSAARDECFLIRIELEDLTSRKIVPPAFRDAAVADPRLAAVTAETERDRQSQLRSQLTEVRRKAVAEARTQEKEMESALRAKVLQHLTGVSADMPQWKRFVGPDQDAREVTRETQKSALQTTIPRETEDKGTRTYLVLTDDEFAALGNPPDPAKVEALLRLKNPTSTLLREDPMALACLKRREENPIDPPPPAPAPSPGTPGSPIEADADAKVAELVGSIRPPEELSLGGQPDQDAVSNNVTKLKLSKGPADVPAFYDFHNLQIAFDHVWEDARAEGYIERAKTAYRLTSELGGDPRAALESSRDPLRALTREMNVVREAQARFAEPVRVGPASPATPGVIYARPRIDVPSGADLDIEIQPWDPPPQPPKPWPPIGGLEGKLDDLFDMYPTTVGENYPFTVFAANSVNFGLLVTYRQCWEPVNYQVGRLVATRTLAPKETISLTTRKVVKTSHTQKQVRASQELRRDEAEDTQRDEAEIVARAQTKTNFALTTQGGYDLGPLGEGSATTTFGRDSDSSSQETKKAFRQAVRKSAQEYRDERRLEVESTTNTETEATEKREITNFNDELALTYIFYELQRRYRVSERLHRATPVVLVAQRVPRPEEITEAWAMRYDWIIRRFLPDDTFKEALTYISTRATGDRIVLDEMKRNMESMRAIVTELKNEIATVRNAAMAQAREIQGYVESKAAIEREEDSEGFFESAWEYAAGSGDESRDAIRVLEEAARERYEKALRDEKDLRARLDREITALQVATDTYTKAYAENANQRVQINRLLKHLQDFILHYMQGIWSYEHPDQQFFRHHTLPAPRLEALSRSYTLTPLGDWPIGTVPQPGKTCYEVSFVTEIDPDLDDAAKMGTLAELADLDRPLGYKGNYIIYPLRKSNALTDFMLTPYLDSQLGLRDPDGVGNWTLQEFSDYVQCLRKSLTPEQFAEIEPQLTRHYQELLADPVRDGEEIIVPTQSLYMQMIVDTGKALEQFKEAHRLIDVMKVKAEVRSAELDNLRRAKLVLGDKLEDPNIESIKNVYYHGATPPHDGDE